MHTFLLFVAGTTGFEPALSALTGLHVNHYTTSPIGDPSGIRTRDLHLERVASWAARRWGHSLLTLVDYSIPRWAWQICLAFIGEQHAKQTVIARRQTAA